MKIIPAILEETFGDVEALAESVTSVDTLHLDICDGVFVPSTTWPFTNVNAGHIEQDLTVHQILAEEIGLPRWEQVDYQFDLMVKNAHLQVDTWARLGATLLIFHPSAFDTTADLEKAVTETQSLLTDAGLAFTCDEWLHHKKDIEYLFSQIKVFQCMSIKHIGVQGEHFDDRWEAEIADLKKTYPHLIIQMDGGIHIDNIEDVQASGVDCAIVGSAIFEEGNANDNLEELLNTIHQ